MSQRRYGPVEGAGTVVIEKDAEKQIDKGALGTTIHVGIFERGPVGQLFRVGTKTEFTRKAGGIIDESLAPDAAHDFYSTSRGAGELYAVRITDGEEIASELTVKSRKRAAIIGNVAADCSGDKVYLTDAQFAAMGTPKVGDRMAVYNDDVSTALFAITAILADTPTAGLKEIALTGATLTPYTLVSGAKVLMFNLALSPEVMKLTAINGGRWGGKKSTLFDDAFGGGGLTETTFDTGVAMKKDFYKGALLALAAIPGKSYEIVSNTAAGVVTVVSDATMATDYTATGSSDETWKLYQENNTKHLSVQFLDGVLNPTTEFGMKIYLDGTLVLNYENLSMDPASEYYFADYVNDDDNNDFVTVENLWTGGVASWVRPANLHGQSIDLSNTVLEFEPVEWLFEGDGNGLVKDFTFGGDSQPDTFELECTGTGPAVFKMTSTKMGEVATGIAITVPFAAPTEFGIGVTIIEGTTPFSVGDKFTLYSAPLTPNALAGGKLYPDVDTNRRIYWDILTNTFGSITVKPTSTMLDSANVGKTFRAEYADQFAGGYDGLADIADNDYLAVLDPATTTLRNLFGKSKGLVKIAIPGVTSVAVQKAGQEVAEALNYQFRCEIPSNIVTEDAAEEYINDTLGRNDFSVVTFPSYYYKTDPTKAGLKLVSSSGAIHGREALTAKNYGGYHKAAAGIDITIPACIKLPTGDRTIDEELTNKQGIGILKFKDGNCIVWGDRTISVDPAWKWKHQREMFSHYENDLREKFDWIIFSINDPVLYGVGIAALQSYFRPEWKNRALQGKNLKEAADIKLDSEINTPATRSKGDVHSEITLWPADTVERFIITIGKRGIFEAVAA